MRGKIRGADIVAARALAGLSQRELADLLGVTQATISRWEIGCQSPTASLHLKLSRFLDEAKMKKSVEQFVGHSPFAMALITRNWIVLSASSKLAEFNGTEATAMRGRSLKEIATAEMERVVATLDERGFFSGAPNAYRIIARGVYTDGRPMAYDAIATPVPMDGEIVRLCQMQPLDDQEYVSLRRQYDLVTPLD